MPACHAARRNDTIGRCPERSSAVKRGVRRAHVPDTTLTVRELVAGVFRPIDVEQAESELAAISREQGEFVLFASARGALTATLEILAPKGRIAIPGFTCTAVANAILSAGGEPVYVDVGDDGLVGIESWPACDLAIVQNTYGFPAPVPNGSSVIVDTAHRVDLLWRTDAPVSITSFEQSKWLSTGQGGLAFTRDASLAAELRRRRDRHPDPGNHITHLLVTMKSLILGRLEFAGQGWITSPARRVLWHFGTDRARGQTLQELHGGGVAPGLRGRPNRGVTRLVESQFRKLTQVGEHRARVVGIYDAQAGIRREPEALVRYPMTTNDPHAFEEAFRREGWDITGRWFAAPLHPPLADPQPFGYEPGSAPVGERLASTVVNLPTHRLISDSIASRLIATALAAGAKPLEVQS